MLAHIKMGSGVFLSSVGNSGNTQPMEETGPIPSGSLKLTGLRKHVIS